MAFDIGGMRIPTPGDVVNGVEATIGNVVEGIIEGVTGEQVELTPGNGVNNTRAQGPRGAGEVKFDKKLASHDEFEKLRKEVQGSLRRLTKDVAKIRVQQEANKRLRPLPSHPVQTIAPTGAGGMNPMMMLLLAQGGGGGALKQNPLMLMMLAQNMQGMSVGSVGGSPINIDFGQIAMLQMVMNEFGSSSAPSAPRTIETPATPG